MERLDYDAADSCAQAAELLRRAIADELLTGDITYERETHAMRLRDARDIVSRTRDVCADRLRRLDDDLREREDELRAQQQRELAHFPDFWEDPSEFHEWNKASAQLLQMRQQEKCMALTGDFQAARAMKRWADALEREETQAAQDRAKGAMEFQFQQMLDRHARETTARERLRHKLCTQAAVVNDTELRPLEAAVKKLEALQGGKPLPRRGPPVSPSQIVMRRFPSAEKAEPPPVQTPRTSGRLNRIRATPRSDVLALTKVEAAAALVKVYRADEKKESLVRRKKAEAF
jgi:hypothetical protein